MSKSEQSPYVEFRMFRKSDTGRLLGVNLAWVRTIEEDATGTVITYMNGDREELQEEIGEVASIVTRQVDRPKRRTRRRER